MATLHLFRGYPGSGKSTAAQKLFPGVVLFENDMYLMRDGKYCWSKDTVKDAVKWCYSSVENALKNGIDVCVANTFTKRRFIESYKQLAEKYGAEVCASRKVVDSGVLPYEKQVGLTGRTIAPKVYVAFGISGAVQHTSAIEGAVRIIAINEDKNARIFDYADYGIIKKL